MKCCFYKVLLPFSIAILVSLYVFLPIVYFYANSLLLTICITHSLLKHYVHSPVTLDGMCSFKAYMSHSGPYQTIKWYLAEQYVFLPKYW